MSLKPHHLEYYGVPPQTSEHIFAQTFMSNLPILQTTLQTVGIDRKSTKNDLIELSFDEDDHVVTIIQPGAITHLGRIINPNLLVLITNKGYPQQTQVFIIRELNSLPALIHVPSLITAIQLDHAFDLQNIPHEIAIDLVSKSTRAIQ